MLSGLTHPAILMTTGIPEGIRIPLFGIIAVKRRSYAPGILSIRAIKPSDTKNQGNMGLPLRLHRSENKTGNLSVNARSEQFNCSVALFVAFFLTACSSLSTTEPNGRSNNTANRTEKIPPSKLGVLTQVPGKPGIYYVRSEMGGPLYLRGVPAGTIIRSPQTGKLFRVP